MAAKPETPSAGGEERWRIGLCVAAHRSNCLSNIKTYRAPTARGADRAAAVGLSYVRVASDVLMIAIGSGMVVDAIRDLGRSYITVKEIHMPKGQQRGNKEAKKPKQPAKTSIPASSSAIPPARPLPAPVKRG